MKNITPRFSVGCACLILGTAFSLSLNSCYGNFVRSNEVRDVIDNYHAALVSDDVTTLNVILKDHVRVISESEDSLLSKNEVLRRFHSLDGELKSVDTSDVNVEIDGNAATLKCFTKMVLQSSNANQITHEGFYSYGLEIIDERWKISSIRRR